MEYLKPKQAVTGRVILQLHGGGYIGPMKIFTGGLRLSIRRSASARMF